MVHSLNSSGPRLGRIAGRMWPIGVAVVCAAVAVRPDVALPVLAGLALVVCAVLAPRATVGLTVLATLGVRTLVHLIPITEVGYLDEAMVAFCAVVLPLRRLATGGTLRALPGQVFFAVFAVLGLAGGLLAGVAAGDLAVAAFLMLKGVLFGWAVAQVDWEARHLRRAAGAGAVVLVVCLLAVAANLAVPGVWAAVFGNEGRLDYRFSGVPSLIGPFVHPLDLGQVMVSATIALVAWRALVGKRPATLVLMVLSGAAALLTFRRTAMAAMLVGVLWLKAALGAARLLLVAALVLPIAGILLFAPLQDVVARTYADYVVQADSSARTLLTRDSAELAVERFPLGAGFGRFGSQVAATSYSPEYVARGYPAIWGLGPTETTGQFLTDTEWPAIIGESGLVGAAAFALGLASIYRRAAALRSRADDAVVRWAGATLMGWTVVYLVLSIATVVFTGPPVFALLFGLAGVVGAHNPPAGPTRPDTPR